MKVVSQMKREDSLIKDQKEALDLTTLDWTLEHFDELSPEKFQLIMTNVSRLHSRSLYLQLPLNNAKSFRITS